MLYFAGKDTAKMLEKITWIEIFYRNSRVEAYWFGVRSERLLQCLQFPKYSNLGPVQISMQQREKGKKKQNLLWPNYKGWKVLPKFKGENSLYLNSVERIFLIISFNVDLVSFQSKLTSLLNHWSRDSS